MKGMGYSKKDVSKGMDGNENKNGLPKQNIKSNVKQETNKDTHFKGDSVKENYPLG